MASKRPTRLLPSELPSTPVRSAVPGLRDGAGRDGAESAATAGTVSGHSAAVLIRASGRPAEHIEFETAVVSFFTEASDLLGVPKSLAAIYGICFASAEPLSFADFCERLDISAGSISQGLRLLRQVGALTVVNAMPASALPGVDLRRRDYYEPALGLRKVVAHFIDQRLDPQLKGGLSQLQALAKRVPKSGASSKVLKARMKALQTWHGQARAVLPVVKTLLRIT